MIRSKYFIAAGVLGLSLASANAQTPVSPAGETCAAFSASYASVEGGAAKSWIIGYLDGVSELVDNEQRTKGLPPAHILAGLESGSIVSLVHEFCHGHPERTIAEAASEVGAQLIAEDRRYVRRNGIATSSETVIVRPERRRVETTGAAVETTGSIGRSRVIAIHSCERITVGSPVVRHLRKCD